MKYIKVKSGVFGPSSPSFLLPIIQMKSACKWHERESVHVHACVCARTCLPG